MAKETNVLALSVLINEALELAGGKSSEASVILVDGAISIAVSRLGPNAPQMATYLAEYVVQQTDFATRSAGHA